MKTSLRDSIYHYIRLQYPNWVRGVEIQRLAQNRYFKDRYYSGETAARETRRISEDLVARKKDGKLVLLRYKPQRYGVLDGEKHYWDLSKKRVGEMQTGQAKLI